MTCVASATLRGAILLLHTSAGSRALRREGVGHHVLPWRYQLEGAGLCLCILTTVDLVAV